MLAYLRDVPWMVWAALAPAAIIVLLKFVHPEGVRVVVVGAGAVAQLTPEAAPEGTYYDLSVQSRQGLSETVAAVQHEMTLWPAVMVLSLDTTAVNDDAGDALARQALAQLVGRAEEADVIAVVLPFSGGSRQAALNDWFRTSLCQQDGSRICVGADANDAPGDLVAATAHAVNAATSRLQAGYTDPTTQPSH